MAISLSTHNYRINHYINDNGDGDGDGNGDGNDSTEAKHMTMAMASNTIYNTLGQILALDQVKSQTAIAQVHENRRNS